MVDIIITWRDRGELRQALPRFGAAAARLGGEVAVVNYGGSMELLRGQVAGCDGHVRVVEVPNTPYFHKARALNLGAASTARDLLFFCDADILLEPEVLEGLVEKLMQRADSFATLKGVRETELNARGGNNVVCFGYELRVRVANGRELRIVDHEEDAVDGTRNAPGLLLVRREHFLQIEGFNSQLHGWGWEDQDMIARLTLGAGLHRILDGSALHISHADSLRIAHYPVSNRWESRDRMFRQALENYDRGDFLGTYSADIREAPSRVVLFPV
jgi:hypothetical protein